MAEVSQILLCILKGGDEIAQVAFIIFVIYFYKNLMVVINDKGVFPAI